MSFILEYQKCSEDCVYFIEKYFDIELYPYQKGMLWNIQENNFFLVNSCRQSGKSMILIYFMIWYSLFHQGKNSLLLFTKSDSAKYAFQSIIDKLKNNTEFDFFIHVSSYGIKDSFITFKNGSTISFYGGKNSPYSTKGRQVHLLAMDEPAYMDYFEELWYSIYPVICSVEDGRVILAGSRNKVDDGFDEIYKGSITGRNHWKSMTVNWWDIPGRNLKWRDAIRDSLGEKNFIKEYTTDF